MEIKTAHKTTNPRILEILKELRKIDYRNESVYFEYLGELKGILSQAEQELEELMEWNEIDVCEGQEPEKRITNKIQALEISIKDMKEKLK